eukprot:6446696-Pyramimonas_sp.AAC.1
MKTTLNLHLNLCTLLTSLDLRNRRRSDKERAVATATALRAKIVGMCERLQLAEMGREADMAAESAVSGGHADASVTKAAKGSNDNGDNTATKEAMRRLEGQLSEAQWTSERAHAQLAELSQQLVAARRQVAALEGRVDGVVASSESN